jgi:acyl-CoA reductase-like NAD-dependent aldehyde dehydrogenase
MAILKPKKTKTGSAPSRLTVYKTYKMFINGAFVRSERGRVLQMTDSKGEVVGNVPWATRKDFRNAMVAARKAQAGWIKRSAFNRSQILYRIAEMMENRRALLENELVQLLGLNPTEATEEVNAAIDRMFWYAGWADKFPQVLGGINPVASPFFNFTFPEPVGVVAILTPAASPLLGTISAMAPVIVSGNSCILISETKAPALLVSLAEILATSDVPAGVVNILTGKRDELTKFIAEHMDLNAVFCFGGTPEEQKLLQQGAAESVKRVKLMDEPENWRNDENQSLYWIQPFVEWKTAWHPMGT